MKEITFVAIIEVLTLGAFFHGQLLRAENRNSHGNPNRNCGNHSGRLR